MNTRILKCLLLALATTIFVAVPAFAQTNIVKLPGAATDVSWGPDWFKYPVMGTACDKGDDWANMFIYLQPGPGKTWDIKQGSNVELPEDWAYYKVGFGKNPADRQSWGNMVFGVPVPGQYCLKFEGVYWPRGTTKSFWLPTKIGHLDKHGKIVFPGNWQDVKVSGWISWYTNAYYHNGNDVNYKFERLMDGTFVPAGHAKEAIPSDAVSARPMQ
jgi:hypothetical protein